MDGIGPGPPRRINDRINPQVAFARRARPNRVRFVGEADMKGGTVAVRIDGHGGDVHFAARTDDAHRDLAAVGYQYFFHKGQ
jgi:hypothetical protein